MIRQNSVRLLGALFVLSVLFAASARGVEEAAIREQITALDDDSFAVRQGAAATLLEMGEAAVPFLQEAKESESVERRARATELIGMIIIRRLEREFEALGKLADDEIDVERGMCLIAQILDPEVTRESIGAQLDAIAETVRREMGAGVDASSLTTKERAEALTAVLRDEVKLQGDRVTYDHPDNSSVHRVLDQKHGLPILLSEIAVAVGRRVEVPVVGLAVPGRYMIMFLDDEGGGGIIVDPHNGWGVRKVQEVLRRWVFGLPPDDALSASPPRDTLVRMLSNLESDFSVVGDGRRARAVAKYRALVEGGKRDE